MMLPLATETFVSWLVRELGSPPVVGLPVLVRRPEARVEEIVGAAEWGDASIFTSPAAVEAVSSALPADLLARVLRLVYAIGPITASAAFEAASRAGARAEVRSPEGNDSLSLAAMLEEGPRYVLWCSSGVSPQLERRVLELGGRVVKLYRVEVDRRAAEEASSLLASGSVKLLVMASSSSLEAWRAIRGSAPRPLAAAAISWRVASGLRGDPLISSVAWYDGDIRGFPAFLGEVYWKL